MIVGFLWTIDRPDALIWSFRIGGSLAVTFALGLLLKLILRSDRHPDYLRLRTKTSFDREGFCFDAGVSVKKGVALMTVYFQTQYDQHSEARVALRPARSIFGRRSPILPMYFDIDCPPAGFGVARVAFAFPSELQGKCQAFEVGATVRYPDGQGQQIRFHEGVLLRSNSDFVNVFHGVLAICAAVLGMFILIRPTTIKLMLPQGVNHDIPELVEPEVIIMWQLGDPSLENETSES